MLGTDGAIFARRRPSSPPYTKIPAEPVLVGRDGAQPTGMGVEDQDGAGILVGVGAGGSEPRLVRVDREALDEASPGPHRAGLLGPQIV